MKAPLLNPLLTGIATRFMAGLPLAGTRIAPVLNTNIRSAAYYIYENSNFTDIPTDIRRGPSSPFKRLTSKLSDDTFLAKDYGIEEPIDNSEMEIYASVFQADRSAMERALRVVAINHEIRVRNVCRALTQTGTPTVKWNVGDLTSTIVADVHAAKNAIQASIGVDPNLMTLPRDVYNALKLAPEIKGYFAGVVVPVVTKAMLESIFEIEIIVTNDLINNAAEGQAASLGGIWSDEVVFSYSNPSQDIKGLNFMRTFNWTAVGGSGPNGISTFTYPEENIDSRIVRARQFTDEKVIAAGAAYYLSNVLA
jgi:hypothetical protein